MATKITSDILEGYLNCRLKGHLKITGQRGTKCDYEVLRTEMRAEVRLTAIDKILSSHPKEDIPRHVPLTTAMLKKGASFILDATLEDDLFSLTFDGLKRVNGPSKLGDFHYVPALFSEGETVRKEQRALLVVYGLLVSRLQGQMPVYGIIWYGKQCKTTKVRLNADLRSTERLLRELKEMSGAESPPPLILNDHCQVCEFKTRCHAQAVQEDNISLLSGLGEKNVLAYARKGILTVTQLAHTFRPRRRGKRANPKENHRYHALQALAVRDKRVYIFGTPQLPAAPVHIFLDFEGNPEERFVYLIGIIVMQGDKEERFSFWADSKDQEDRIFEHLVETVSRYADFIVFAYGGYERAFIQRMRTCSKHQATVDKLLKSLVNVLSLIYSHFYFPTYSNGLKDIGACLECTWTEPDASGIQSLVWRKRWEFQKADDQKNILTTYNMEDCEALKRVTAFIYSNCSKAMPNLASQTQNGSGPIVASLEEFDRLGSVNKRGRKEFFHDDFAHINGCARFDYQRQRVYVRLGKRRRPAIGRKVQEFHNLRLRVTHRVVITSRKCPFCESNQIARPPKAHFGKGCFTKAGGKRAFDLVFTSSGIKRKVIECKASVHHCLKCGEHFVPQRYERLAKHFHGLMSWAMHEHVAHRIGGPTVSEMLKDFFGLTVHPAEVSRFRPMMARYYKGGYKRLLAKITSNDVLQIDETEVKLRNEKGYVWVFTTSEDVVYMYRPTREGEFLHDLLKGFHGVLVTDFFPAYDSIDCAQQKCLLHLMRDMNQELLNNPFDEDFQSVTSPFGTLLREIVGTIDEYGLKRKHLIKHERKVTVFFSTLEKQSFRSEAAEALRARILKNRHTLFTFIQYDGVPWNNNTPENAIRRFAYYRDSNPGRMKRAGLEQYLVLLSLCQTCHYKNISFLKFLLSKERDIDEFRQHQRRKRPKSSIEIYPSGVERPDMGGRKVRTPVARSADDEHADPNGKPPDIQSKP